MSNSRRVRQNRTPKSRELRFSHLRAVHYPSFDAFKQGLADLGYIDGQSIVIEPRFAEGQYDRFPEILAELVRLKVVVHVVTAAVTVRAPNRGAHLPEGYRSMALAVLVRSRYDLNLNQI